MARRWSRAADCSRSSSGNRNLNRQYGQHRFTTIPPVIDRTEGFTALRLYREQDGRSSVCAEVVYWDACGQYVMETFDGDVPVDIIEELIAEAKESIKYK